MPSLEDTEKKLAVRRGCQERYAAQRHKVTFYLHKKHDAEIIKALTSYSYTLGGNALQVLRQLHAKGELAKLTR